MAEFEIGDPVVRIRKDHLFGRIGTVIALGPPHAPERIRVHWHSDEGGHPIKWRGTPTTDGLKTWLLAEYIRKR